MKKSLRRSLTAVALLAVTALGLTACASSGDVSGSNNKSSGSSGSITIGSANFPESQLLAEIYAQALEGKGYKVTRNFNIGSREVYLKALKDGSIDLIPEYTGNTLNYYVAQNGTTSDATDPDQIYADLKKNLPKELTVLDKSAAEDKDSLVVTKETADKYKLKSIEDLKPVAGDLIMGAGPEFETRKAGLVGLKDIYGIVFKSMTTLDAGGPLTVNAVKDGSVDVGDIFSTDPAIEENHFVTLTDPKNVFTPQNVVPLGTKAKLKGKAVDALNAVSKSLTTDKLKSMMKEISIDKADIDTVAKKYLKDN
ncbi:osmoprotectant transport system substrate-binding protein [Antricoccus suffuscus]|uniref:Osmoprotectant transport system substrate-binding protein n=1 Tax=Antricoccus suffuscus TaxID=1629062 RepID=A0A2T0ZY03_9ACTN|nr:ABC transporter substrate-binding protein [Antricoccus suffuscus]PRZ41213.1 osmoprotectant transport system substrate-binding protein [Antricoccus suffuscus]